MTMYTAENGQSRAKDARLKGSGGNQDVTAMKRSRKKKLDNHCFNIYLATNSTCMTIVLTFIQSVQDHQAVERPFYTAIARSRKMYPLTSITETHSLTIQIWENKKFKNYILWNDSY